MEYATAVLLRILKDQLALTKEAHGREVGGAGLETQGYEMIR